MPRRLATPGAHWGPAAGPQASVVHMMLATIICPRITDSACLATATAAGVRLETQANIGRKVAHISFGEAQCQHPSQHTGVPSRYLAPLSRICCSTECCAFQLVSFGHRLCQGSGTPDNTLTKPIRCATRCSAAVRGSRRYRCC